MNLSVIQLTILTVLTGLMSILAAFYAVYLPNYGIWFSSFFQSIFTFFAISYFISVLFFAKCTIEKFN